jgi:ParB/RepB/Spo0J family partition protein
MQAPTFQQLPVKSIMESPLNPRKDFDKKALAELQASIADKGVLEPLLVRPATSPGGAYEVMAGARRLRAAKAAGLDVVPCLVREATDAELLEVALLENVIRQDINPIEEGEGFARLVKEYSYSADALAKKTGKSRTVIYSRMKLAQLQGRARQLVLEEGLSPSIGELLARLPTLAAQEEAVAHLEEQFGDQMTDFMSGDEKPDWRLLLYRDAKEELENSLRLVLADAPFDVKDATLHAPAGACGSCPKRTSVEKVLFPDVKADTCLDSACWATKKNIALQRLRAELEEKGNKLVKGGAKLFSEYQPDQLTHGAREKYARPSDELADGKKLKDVLDKKQLEAVSVVAVGPDGKPHTLVDKAAAAELLKKEAPALAKALKPSGGSSGGYDWRAENEKLELKRQAYQVARAQVVTAALKTWKGDVFKVLRFFVDSMGSWERNNAAELAGVPKGAKSLTDEQRLSILICVALRDSDAVKDAAKALKLDFEKLEKEALAKVKAEKASAETTAKLKAADKAQAKKKGGKA